MELGSLVNIVNVDTQNWLRELLAPGRSDFTTPGGAEHFTEIGCRVGADGEISGPAEHFTVNSKWRPENVEMFGGGVADGGCGSGSYLRQGSLGQSGREESRPSVHAGR
ncbi:MAG TPA: hypothetical protein VFW09_16925 [Solirubrobacteraceae bacterium]|nr:hypothetical protein [Solirubrobacteraceae bacterium]